MLFAKDWKLIIVKSFNLCILKLITHFKIIEIAEFIFTVKIGYNLPQSKYLVLLLLIGDALIKKPLKFITLYFNPIIIS